MSDTLSRDELGDAFERFDHLALAVHDIEAALPMMRLIGAEYRTGGRHPTAGFVWVQFLLPGGPKLELLAPTGDDPDHFLNRFLERRGEGLHHVTLKVRDLRRAVTAARRAGYDVVGESYVGGWQEAFVHPRTAHGLLIQLAQWDDDESPAPRALDEVLEGADRS